MKKKILYVFGGEFASGGEYVIERLIVNNAEVEPFLFISPGAYCNKLKEKYDFDIVEIPALKKLNRSQNNILIFLLKAISNYFILSKKVISYIRKNKINIVHANTLGPATYLIPAIYFSKILRLRNFWIWSDHDLTHHSSLDNKLIKYCGRIYTATLAVSNAVKNKYTSDNQKIKVLYNGLDIEYFQKDEISRQRFRINEDIDEDCLIIGIAGFIGQRKGQVQLIDAIQILSNSFPKKLKLMITGRPLDENDNYYKLFLEKLRSNPNVSYLGGTDDMVTFYNGCDIIVNNSSIDGSEPLGTTIYEAMACEKVVVAARVGGTPEIIEDRVDGFIFEAENLASFTETITEIILGKYNLLQITKNARKKVVNKFNVKVMSTSYNGILNEIINK
ncbi:glycosyltransferase family 4 protein [Pedobacter sp. GSP4]|uniref:glycosyltransferase family 4 protein n=1 Tax=Pedobacter sp. GSP4 TaxID=3453716 RepID=UPI003EECEC41